MLKIDDVIKQKELEISENEQIINWLKELKPYQESERIVIPLSWINEKRKSKEFNNELFERFRIELLENVIKAHGEWEVGNIVNKE